MFKGETKTKVRRYFDIDETSFQYDYSGSLKQSSGAIYSDNADSGTSEGLYEFDNEENINYREYRHFECDNGYKRLLFQK